MLTLIGTTFFKISKNNLPADDIQHNIRYPVPSHFEVEFRSMVLKLHVIKLLTESLTSCTVLADEMLNFYSDFLKNMY